MSVLKINVKKSPIIYKNYFPAHKNFIHYKRLPEGSLKGDYTNN